MTTFNAYKYGVTSGEIVRPGKKFVIRRGTNKEGYHGYCEAVFFITPSKKEAFEKGLLKSVNIKKFEDQYIYWSEETIEYNGEDPIIIEQCYSGVNSSKVSYIICVPDNTDVLFKPEIKPLTTMHVPKRLWSRWVKECCKKNNRDPKYYYQYGRVLSCLERKKIIFSLCKYKEKIDAPIFAKYFEYWQYDPTSGSNELITAYAYIANGNVNIDILTYNKLLKKLSEDKNIDIIYEIK